MQVAGVILAGGQGSRFGGADKALLMLGGRTLLSRAAARLSPQVAALAISANGDPARFASFGLPVLPDDTSDDRPDRWPARPGTLRGDAPDDLSSGPQQSAGPLAGILAALDWAAAQGAAAVVSVAVDTPFFPRDLVTRLIRAAAPNGFAVAQSNDRLHPVFALWPVAARGALRRVIAAGTRRVTEGQRQVIAATARPVTTRPGIAAVAAGPGIAAVAAGPGIAAVAAGPGSAAVAAGPGSAAVAAGPGIAAVAAGPGIAAFVAGERDPFFNINTPADLLTAQRWCDTLADRCG